MVARQLSMRNVTLLRDKPIEKRLRRAAEVFFFFVTLEPGVG